MTTPRSIRPVILAGGAGTRLWPVSREKFPKQFGVPAGGETTLFQATAQRLYGEGFGAPLVITSEPFRFVVLEQLDETGISPVAVLVEPEPRGTAPATAAALAWAEAETPGELLLIAPSDHAIPDAAMFRAAVRRAADAACSHIVAFGVMPDRPETGYGWLELAAGADVRADTPQDIAAFVEKPDEARAAEMFATGWHLWNAGLFLAHPETLAAAFESHAPDLRQGARKALQTARSDIGFIRLDPDEYALLETVSLDRAIMEKAGDLRAMPWRGGWTDLGSWDAVWRASEGDAAGNVTAGPASAIDCRDSYLSADEGMRLVGIGLESMVAVALPDAVLVAPREAVQKVGQAVRALKAEDVPQATEFPKEHRPWGWFETLALGARFRVKRIVVKPGGRLSLQAHAHRAEHWVVVEGTARVTIGDKKQRLGENQSLYVPVGEKHRLENLGAVPVVLVEVQTGAYLGEDDIIRFDDVYARDTG